jgi:[acyl-carrier-protein] S-malonyltransferase
VQRGQHAVGDVLGTGEHVVTVISRHEEQKLFAERGGILLEWLADDGDPVAPGQPLVRIHTTGEDGR